MGSQTTLAGEPGTPGLRVLMFYEDVNAARAAQKAFERFTENLSPNEVCSSMWRFDVLRVPTLCDLASREAREADLLIVSCRGDRRVPADLQVWLEGWLSEPRRAMALVVMLDPELGVSRTAHELRRYFSEVSQRARVQFYCEPPALAPPEAAPSWPPPGTHFRASSDTIVSHWGINE